MNIVGGFDDAVNGWVQRLALSFESPAHERWNFSSDALSRLFYRAISRFEYMNCGFLRSMIPASVSLSGPRAVCAKAAERIDFLFGVKTPGDRRNIALEGEMGSMRPLSNYFGHLLLFFCVTLSLCL